MSAGTTSGLPEIFRSLRFWKLASVTVVLGLVLAFCLPRWETFRYRLTFEIETPEGVKTGTGVFENRWVSHVFTVRGVSVQCVLIGEAVAINLGARGYVFATFHERADDGRTHASGTYGCNLPLAVARRLDPAEDNRQRRLVRGGLSTDLLPAEVPLLVRFGNPAQPTSVEDIDPYNIAARLGPGVRLRRVRFETTADVVTRGHIVTLLPWLSTLRGHLDGSNVVQIANYSLANALSTSSFMQDEQ